MANICPILHELIEGCVLILSPCYTTKETRSISKRQTQLMDLALQILLPDFTYANYCNNNKRRKSEKEEQRTFEAASNTTSTPEEPPEGNNNTVNKSEKEEHRSTEASFNTTFLPIKRAYAYYPHYCHW